MHENNSDRVAEDADAITGTEGESRNKSNHCWKR